MSIIHKTHFVDDRQSQRCHLFILSILEPFHFEPHCAGCEIHATKDSVEKNPKPKIEK